MMRSARQGLTRLMMAGALASLSPVGSAGAWDPDAPVTRLYPELHRAYYDMSVCEYCGLVSAQVLDAFRREVSDLVARDRLAEAQHREVRIHAWTAADLEYGNRGLGGFRAWCRTEGASAAERFLDYRGGVADEREMQ